MELVSQLIVEPVVNLLTVHITQKLRNLTSSADRVKEMIEKMEVLDGHRVDNENHLRRNRENHLEIPDRVRGWLNEAKKIKEDVENDGCFVLETKMRRNSENNQEIPDRVPESLEEVETIKEDADNIPTNNDGCFNIKKKYRAGRNALRYIKVINRLIRESSEMNWSDAPIGFGRVDSKRLASTSGGGTENLFKSRDKPFNDALKLLQQNDDDAARVIALCGMGGVGKTTLKDDLKKVATDNKMFNLIVDVPIGKSSNLFKIQKVIAADTGAPLTETDETVMATSLSKRFEEFSKRKEKILVILDDVWKESKIKLKDIGLASPLPNGFKLLLTSRDALICRQIAVDADSALEEVEVDFLEEGEAQDFFFRIAGNSARHDRDLSKIGCEIVRKCGCLPLAIKIIAATLKCEENMSKWRSTLNRLKRNELEDKVQEIIEISYDSLEREDKAIFQLCGLFPEDSNIPIEDLTRYAWGLNLLKQDSTMGNARDSTQTSVINLKNKYLLLDGDSRHSDCVKMHDLVLAFAVATVSKGGEDGCWIIHHENFSKWSEADNMSQSCKQLSLTCKGMSEFPSEFQFPNLLLLKLMHGNESLRFPHEDFYVGMKKLQVIAFEKLEYPPVPASFQCSTRLRTLRTLCLHECSLMFDLNCIGNLSNLEVLSFANSHITILPSTFGNLKELRLLDVTGCYNLAIDDGVLGSLVKLEELYMIPYDEKACCFTDNNNSELAERSKNLCALEFEFIGNNAHMKNVSCEKLKRFKLSVGCSFTEVRNALGTRQVDTHSYENSLKLVTNKEELLKSKINELFKKTNALYLQVNDMNSLEDAEIPHPPQNSSFYNLRLLVVSQCAELKYLFTLSVATSLSKLEYLEISGCLKMEAVIHTTENYVDVFSKLKYLRLAELPELLHFCNKVDVIELPRLMELQLEGLPKITSIYPDSATSSNISPTQSFLNAQDATRKLEKLSSSLRRIKVKRCDSLVKLFPCNPFPFLNNLQELSVKSCGSIQVLFNTDLGRAGKSEEQVCCSSLRSIKVSRCDSLVNLFSCNLFPFLNNLQELSVKSCGSIQVLFNTDLGRAGKSEEQVCSSSLRSIKVWCCGSLVNILPSNPMPLFNNLEELEVISCASVEVIFDIDMGCVGEMDKVSSSSLRSIVVEGCDSLVKLFSCNPFPFLNNLQELNVKSCGSIQVLFNIDSGRAGKMEELVCSSNLRSIVVEGCDSLVKLFSCNPFPFLNNLQELKVESCGSIQVLFNTDLECAGKSEEQVCSSSLRSISVEKCDSLVKLFSYNAFPFLNNLQELEVTECASIEVIFDIDMGCVGEMDKVSSSNLRSIKVEGCGSLLKFFSCNPFPFLNNLQELKVENCGSIQVLFNTDLGRAGKSEEQVCSSSLRSIKVFRCACLVNLLPSNPMPLFNHLEELEVVDCASIEVIFDIEMGCVGEMDKVSSSRLRSIHLWRLGKLREVWRIKDAGNNLIHGFEAVESIRIVDCESFEKLITPAITTFDMRALKEVKIKNCGRESEINNELVESKQDQEIKVISKVALPSLHTFHHLHKLLLRNYKAAEVVFEITAPSSRESPHNTQQLPILPYLEELQLWHMGRMSHVWKCDWNEFLILQKPQSQSSFHNLTTIAMINCNSIKYLFSPLMAKLLFNLKIVHIWQCDGIEEVVSNRDDEDASIYSHTTTTFFPHLDILGLKRLRNFKCIGGGTNGISTDNHDQLKLSSWSLCQYAREIEVIKCDTLSSVVPWYAVGQMQKLHVLKIEHCESMTEVFETQEMNNKSGTNTGKSLPRLEYITMLTKLKILKIQGCNLLKHIFTFSTLESLTQLEELEVKDCKAMEVIVTEENVEQTTASDVVVFLHLKSLKLVSLPNFVGFFLGKNEFIWRALEKVVIVECPQITVFTYGRSTAPNLNFINSSLGKHSVECGLINFHVTTTSHQARLPSYESASSYRPTTMDRLPWSYHNLIELDMENNTWGGRALFSSDKLLQLQKLETVHCTWLGVEEIFDSQTVAEIPNLRQVDLEELSSLKYIWKSKQGTVLKFPNLTRLSIKGCNSLEYVFTCPMVGGLLQLQELHISECDSMKAIVKGEEEECDAIVNATVLFPCLKFLKLESLKSLEGFCLGKEDFEFPSLDTLQIDDCPKMTVFSKGDLSAPKLYPNSSRWYRMKYIIHNRLNSVIKNLKMIHSPRRPITRVGRVHRRPSATTRP